MPKDFISKGRQELELLREQVRSLLVTTPLGGQRHWGASTGRMHRKPPLQDKMQCSTVRLLCTRRKAVSERRISVPPCFLRGHWKDSRYAGPATRKKNTMRRCQGAWQCGFTTTRLVAQVRQRTMVTVVWFLVRRMTSQ